MASRSYRKVYFFYTAHPWQTIGKPRLLCILAYVVNPWNYFLKASTLQQMENSAQVYEPSFSFSFTPYYSVRQEGWIRIRPVDPLLSYGYWVFRDFL